ncbi:hypothetical protein ZEAMMB73_Zm00001d051733 [Zea mays]|uniref:Uncharacterized protein n=1 Tax=Zea mays TaxID=4577 RepID=A0A1D6Q9J4_MAIZE|nr:hypothetical protein ZEAMMB73_Zm00001d051733 [Zea mays]
MLRRSPNSSCLQSDLAPRRRRPAAAVPGHRVGTANHLYLAFDSGFHFPSLDSIGPSCEGSCSLWNPSPSNL